MLMILRNYDVPAQQLRIILMEFPKQAQQMQLMLVEYAEYTVMGLLPE